MSRQAVTKHLRVLEGAGLVAHERAGRESRFILRPERFAQAKTYLEEVSALWDDALGRLKSFVEDESE
jgi:DNA-binding transcriptional ArsR family regulator